MLPGRIAGPDLLEQRAVALERDGEHEQISGAAGGNVFFTRNLCIAAKRCLDFCRRLSRTACIPRSDDHVLTGASPAQRESKAFGAGAAQDGDGAA